MNDNENMYPTKWADFIGQETAKRQIDLAVRSAKARKAPLDHVLLTAPTGYGKTALARLIADTLTAGTKRQVKVVSGPIKWVGAVMLLDDMRDGDVVLYDEFHKVMDGGKKHAEWLLHYLQDGVIVTGNRVVELPKVTIIATTNEPDRLPEAILSRFPIRPAFEPYSTDEAARIAKIMSKQILTGLPDPTPKNLSVIAGASNANPRAIRRLISTVRDLAVTGSRPDPRTGYDMDEVLLMHDVTHDGLDRTARTYLTLLVHEFGGKAGQRAIASRVGVSVTDAESVLLSRGLITRSSSGREVTPAGIRRIKTLEVSA